MEDEVRIIVGALYTRVGQKTCDPPLDMAALQEQRCLELGSAASWRFATQLCRRNLHSSQKKALTPSLISKTATHFQAPGTSLAPPCAARGTAALAATSTTLTWSTKGRQSLAWTGDGESGESFTVTKM